MIRRAPDRPGRRPCGGAPRGRAREGFTLLEVLISIMILVLAIAAIAPLFAVAGTSHQRGVDQSEVAWLAPRIAARLRERLYEPGPREVRGYVKVLADGSFVLDDLVTKLAEDRGATYAFRATFTPVSLAGSPDPMPSTCFVLKVEIFYKEEGGALAESYETVVLRKLIR
ncbi:MAG TPA: type II secretion system protein [Planctomycetota bacterium]|nr:type II secretion system protein [Planctomycetota bacterium]